MEDIIVGLDIGTTKTCAVIGYLNNNNQVEVSGVGVASSCGLKGGVITNIDNTVSSIVKAVDAAELMAGHDVKSVFVGVSGQNIKGENSEGVVAVANGNRTITQNEVKRVIEGAQAIILPVDREILHVLSKEFTVDNQSDIKNPIGMSGSVLKAAVHIITVATSSIENMIKAVAKSGFQHRDIVFNALASAEAVLSRDEKDLGVALLDFGGGTTDLIVFLGGGVAYSAVLPVGSSHITNDISIGLKTPLGTAENIKKKHGCADLGLVDASEQVEVPSVGGREPRRLFRQELTQIIQPRVTEIMEMVDQELVKSGKKEMLSAGIVITGGGSMIDGCIEAAEKVFNMPVRIGLPEDIVGLKEGIVDSPQFANGVGLLKYGIKMSQVRDKGKNSNKKEGVISKIKKIFEDYL